MALARVTSSEYGYPAPGVAEARERTEADLGSPNKRRLLPFFEIGKLACVENQEIRDQQLAQSQKTEAGVVNFFSSSLPLESGFNRVANNLSHDRTAA